MKPTSFKLIFLTVVGITLLSGGTSLWLASQPTPTKPQKGMFETTQNTWLMGTGAIFGLLGGRSDSTKANKSDSEN
ncbi:MAG: hypothetical protein RM022_032555 [Nostoc sp. EfeVER01]|uniref:hypothetical protein n=1 Tax=unclassified Nostoc TaxID=2593658 RepID=UPI002AD239E6|nr:MULTISPECIES: hypothetical protein [unclassified Nostoc]MDZ7943826.1 hypothetical protein [Nostoc sp. EfeVER01]MDZ7995996.1 hypothetical protein [Nostoc sp. EspVER01]